MRESDLLSHIFRTANLDRFPQVVVGPGHDCAVVAVPGGGQILLKVDQVVEGLHFAPFPNTPINLIARKAVARAVSDIAATAGRPLATLVGGVLPHECSYAVELSDGLAHWAAHFHAPLIGGDTAIWKPPMATGTSAATPTMTVTGAGEPCCSPLMLAITIVGVPHPVRGPVLRSGARAGDHIYITGSVGGSFDARTSLGRHLTFEPRLAEAAFLADTLGKDLHAMMDISDGLGRDAARLAAASGIRIVLDEHAIPTSAGLTIREAIAQGEDYELLFASPAQLPPTCPTTGTTFTRIGRAERGSGCILRAGGSEIDISREGWEHGG